MILKVQDDVLEAMKVSVKSARCRSQELGSKFPLAVSRGDILNRRYKLIRTIGQERSSTVWLCYDQSDAKRRWKAVKVSSAAKNSIRGDHIIAKLAELRRVTSDSDGDHHICWPTEHFWLDGKYGNKLCSVMELLGPSASKIQRNDPELIRSICSQAAEGLQYLHSRGVCHGNMHPSHIFFRLGDDINDLSEAEIRLLLESADTPGRDRGYTTSTSNRCFAMRNDICIGGFGSAFYANNAPVKISSVVNYAAPEVLLNFPSSYGIDTWALACCIAEIRTGHRLFKANNQDITEAITNLESYLGPLPEPYRGAWRKRSIEIGWNQHAGNSKDRLRNDVMSNNKLVGQEHEKARLEGLRDQQDRVQETHQYPFLIYQAIAQDLISISEPIGVGGAAPIVKQRLSRAEVLIMGDLLCRIFKYDPSDRLSVGEIIEHSWFCSKFRRSSVVTAEHSTINWLAASQPYDSTFTRQSEGIRQRQYHCQRLWRKHEKKVANRQQNSWAPIGLTSKHLQILDVMSSEMASLIFSLAMALVLWVIMMFTRLKPGTNTWIWTPDAIMVERIARSAVSRDFQGKSGHVARNTSRRQVDTD